MRATALFMPTVKEDPADAEAVSHKLMVRGGFVRQFASGIYVFLPLGWRVMARVFKILREEMDAHRCAWSCLCPPCTQRRCGRPPAGTTP